MYTKMCILCTPIKVYLIHTKNVHDKRCNLCTLKHVYLVHIMRGVPCLKNLFYEGESYANSSLCVKLYILRTKYSMGLYLMQTRSSSKAYVPWAHELLYEYEGVPFARKIYEVVCTLSNKPLLRRSILPR